MYSYYKGSVAKIPGTLLDYLQQQGASSNSRLEALIDECECLIGELMVDQTTMRTTMELARIQIQRYIPFTCKEDVKLFFKVNYI